MMYRMCAYVRICVIVYVYILMYELYVFEYVLFELGV